ncbi:MAG: hypothetical protein VKK04_20380 [Synechococcales bacterium]|nr:hypothetical protein [Synechococcales bacterium]
MAESSLKKYEVAALHSLLVGDAAQPSSEIAKEWRQQQPLSVR